MIKLLICNGSTSLELPRPSSSIRLLLSQLPGIGIALAVASNQTRMQVVQNFETAKLPVPEIIVTKEDIGKRKPAPEYIFRIAELTGIARKEMVYLSDRDMPDTLTATNARILPLRAMYIKSIADRQYGIRCYSPEDLLLYLKTFGMKDTPYFGWEFRQSCRDTGSEIDVRALIYDHSRITNELKSVLKNHQDLRIGSSKNHFRGLLFHYFISQAFMSSLTDDFDWITVYPGHLSSSTNPTLSLISLQLTQVFQSRFKCDLLLREKDALDSRKQDKRTIYEQLRTLIVNPNYKQKLRNKNVLVLDDFTTSGCSLEAARRMLLRANARQVKGIAIAKYRCEYTVSSINADWNPFKPCTLVASDIVEDSHMGTRHSDVDDYFIEKVWNVFSG